MLYIDPKDQPAHPDWNPTYAAAWNERKRLRLEHFRLGKEIEQMDQFLAMYEKLEPQQQTVTTSLSTQSGWANTTGSSFAPVKSDG